MADTANKPSLNLSSAPLIPTPAPIAASPAAADKPVRVAKTSKGGWWWGVGRRKTAVARVRIRPVKGGGEGKVIIQMTAKKNKPVDVYFCEERDRADAVSPLKATGSFGKLEVIVRLDGGGYMGQAGAMKLGVARALKDYDPSTEAVLRAESMLTRDSRDVERKKYGQAGARRRFQFSKR